MKRYGASWWIMMFSVVFAVLAINYLAKAHGIGPAVDGLIVLGAVVFTVVRRRRRSSRR
jgi:hypothetical protein